MGMRGFVHTSVKLDSPDTTRPFAVVLLSADERPFRLIAAGQELSIHAAVVGPLVARSLHADQVPLVSLHVSPRHPAFPAFSHSFADDVRVLRRERFAGWNDGLRAAVEGSASLAAVTRLFDEIVAAVVSDHCNDNVPVDPQVDAALQLMEEDLELSVEAVARQIGMTPATLAHRFQKALGLPLRAYQAWLRITRAWVLFAPEKNLSLTDIAYQAGFSDSSHLSRTWRTCYGISPSYMRSGAVRVIR
jgi:AraC-like DNA-binding protein